MRILFVVKEFPHSSVIGGPIIIYNRVKYLSQRHDVSLLAFADSPTREQVSSVAGYCRDLRLVPFPPKRGCLQKAKDLISGPETDPLAPGSKSDDGAAGRAPSSLTPIIEFLRVARPGFV
ncbi:MAG: hypothetical protein MUQ30_02950 [Anaerolineae bacterium]|nr:hypothetical protein [Anaerolineae bacterium]